MRWRRNVIEDFDERLEALQRAWSLAERLLVVSVMLANQNDPRGARFRDGVITHRQTFQKYYTQQAIRERRRPYKQLEAGLQRDIKAFFGGYQAARSAGFARLMQIADVEAIAIANACRAAAEHGLGWLELEGASNGEGAGAEAPATGALTLHTSLVEQLPALLRVYINAAAMLYGDVHNADLLKIQIGSGKLTLMRFDDFDGRALPRMLERVKIKLREQDVDVFGYGELFEPPFLYRKSRFINEEYPGYPEQVVFDEALERLEAQGLIDLSGYGPPAAELLATLKRHRWEIDGLALRRMQTPPELDDPCGQFLTFRDLIECGETWQRLAAEGDGFDNRPKQIESYSALLELAEQVLDPVIDWFGMIRLTYGFCSPALSRQIPGRIDPKRDQHAAHERNRLGNQVCDRLGAAVDFIIPDEDMLEVAQWIVANAAFDRLYFYGGDRPIHVSCGPENSRQIVRMVRGSSGRLIPKITQEAAFLGL